MISSLLVVDSSQMPCFIVAGSIDLAVFRFAHTIRSAAEWCGFNDNHIT
jgi:hypothetical protein